MNSFKISWVDSGKEPQCEPDPAYPEGIDLDLSGGSQICCLVELEYPAKRIGLWRIECETCHKRVAVTTAGRIDDPRSVKIGCNLNQTVSG